MLADHVHGRRARVGQAFAQTSPRRAQVFRDEDARAVVVVPVAVQACVGAFGFGVGRLHPAHVGRGAVPLPRQVPRHVRPRDAAVRAGLQRAVVGARPQPPRRRRRLGQRRDLAVARRAVVLGQGRRVGQRAHDRQAVLVHVARQVLCGAPLVAPVVGHEQPIAAQVHAARVVGRHQDRRLPVEAVFARGVGREGLESLAVAGGHVHAHDSCVLGRHVHGARVGPVGLGVHAVAVVHHLPVPVQDALVAARSAGSPVRVVVLQSAVHVVRVGHVQVHVVELADGKVGQEAPVGAHVPRGVQAAVVPQDHVARVSGVDPQVVVVHVHAGVVLQLHGQRRERAAAVFGAVQGARHQVHALGVVGVDAKLAVVHGALVEVVDLGPRLASVERLEDAAVFRLHDRHDQRRVALRDRQADPPLVAFGQADGQLPPTLAAVDGLVDSAARSAAHEPPRPTTALIGRRVQHRRVGRVHGQIDHARVVVHEQHLAPAHAPVGGLEDAPFRVGAEQVSHRGHPHHVRVGGVHHDAPHVARLLEPGQAPALAPVGGVVDALAPRRAVAVVGLARAHPDLQGVRRRQGQVAHGLVGRVVEDRRPGGAVVVALPHAARRRAHVDA